MTALERYRRRCERGIAKRLKAKHGRRKHGIHRPEGFRATARVTHGGAKHFPFGLVEPNSNLTEELIWRGRR